ncbi:MAG: HAD family hydrolase [Burkholderiaceae bacterium]
MPFTHIGRTRNAFIKAVLFDLDDTLWPIEPVIRRAEHILHLWLQEHVPAVSQRWSIERLRERRSTLMQENPNFQIDLWALRHAGLTEAFIACNANHAMVEDAMAVFARARNAVTLFDDVLPSLARLSRRFRLGSISNGFADLHAIGLAPLFTTSIAAHSYGRAKPDPAIFHAACMSLGIAPAEAVYVGDDLTLDVEASQAAGLRGVWMNRFDRVLPETVMPDATCRDFLELEGWLEAAQAAASA